MFIEVKIPTQNFSRFHFIYAVCSAGKVKIIFSAELLMILLQIIQYYFLRQ